MSQRAPAQSPPPVCKQYLQSQCTYRNCKFLHDPAALLAAEQKQQPTAAPQIPKPKSANRRDGGADAGKGAPEAAALGAAFAAVRVTQNDRSTTAAAATSSNDEKRFDVPRPRRQQQQQQQYNENAKAPSSQPDAAAAPELQAEEAPSRGSRRGKRGGGGGAARDADYGGSGKGGQSYPPGPGMSKLKVPRTNTEDFTPSQAPTMRVVIDIHPET